MKKIFTTISAVLFTISATAQTMNIHFKNGTKVEFSSENVDYVDFTEKSSGPTLTSGEYVDLGLSVMWATCNLGASKPTDAGGYYAWGETKEKGSYTENTYTYYNSTTASYTEIGDDIAGTEFDAAYVNLGDGWKIPNKSQFDELIKECNWTWTSKEGVNGYVITGKNGNNIFIPAASMKGSYFILDSYINKEGFYLASDKASFSKDKINHLWIRGSDYTTVSTVKYYGYTIRPVYSPNK